MTVGINEASTVCVPASNESERVIVAFQSPPVLTVPPLTVNPTDWPSIENRILAGNTVPSLCSRPLPLSETTVPEMLKDSPATGLARMESITRKV